MGANAQTIVPTFTASQVLTADQMNQSARTGVPVFATTVTRDAAFGGTGEKTLAEGQLCYIEAAPKRLQIYNGTAWLDYDAEYTAFTPTWTNLTVGNATQDFTYARLGKLVHYVGYLQLGSTTSVSTAPTLTLPVTAANGAGYNIGTIYYSDGGATPSFSMGYVYTTSTTVLGMFTMLTNGTYADRANVGAAAPFTWATGYRFLLNIVYEAA